MLEGELSPTEGSHVMAMIAIYRRTLETTELELRVLALKAGAAFLFTSGSPSWNPGTKCYKRGCASSFTILSGEQMTAECRASPRWRVC